MPLIVETGANVVNANSYATRAEIIAYAALRGVVIADEDASDALAIEAMDYIEIQTFKGEPTYGVVGVDQALNFPRKCIRIGCAELASDAIPAALKNATCEAAMLRSQGIALLNNRTAGEQAIKVDKTGPLSTEYFEPPMYRADTPRLDALLKPLTTVGFGGVQVLRA